MKKAIVILTFFTSEMIFCGSSSSFDWPLRNEEGQTRNKLRDAQHRIEVIDKRGFSTGSIKPAMTVSPRATKKK